MEFLRLASAEHALFADAFSVYETSFPKHEQRTLEKQKALMANPLYHFDVILESGASAGILLHWEMPGYAYIEHFAIHPSLRGKAVGSGALQAFCRDRPLVILEIDPPADPVAIRREAFYQRLGFRKNDYAYVHPAYQARHAPYALVLMSWPERMTEKEYLSFQKDIHETVMKDAAPGV